VRQPPVGNVPMVDGVREGAIVLSGGHFTTRVSCQPLSASTGSFTEYGDSDGRVVRDKPEFGLLLQSAGWEVLLSPSEIATSPPRHTLTFAHIAGDSSKQRRSSPPNLGRLLSPAHRKRCFPRRRRRTDGPSRN
jgi:hypothetical protein